MTNITGWNEISQGNIISAVFKLYDGAMMGYSVFILFLLFQFLVYIKTRNTVLMWVSGIIFGSLYLASSIITSYSKGLIFAILIFEGAGILYYMFFK